ncbi:MAG: TVP38/TMEM64 family protein [Clostridiales bacterium]|nr:TVP38/TMEM64 family protein [Clostridiales bacterium]
MIDKSKRKKIIIASITALLFTIAVIVCLSTYTLVVKIALISLVLADLALFVFGILFSKEKLYKIAIIIAYFGIVLISAATAVLRSGILEGIDSTEELVALINGFGMGGKLIFILIQFLQVTFIPIPSTIVTATGAALYSPWEAVILSSIGLWIGSFVAFALGRVFGVKLVKWVIGEDMLIKYNNFVKGKDKAMLVYMFIFPVFPDDMLCMLAGLTTMSYPGFMLIQLIARPLNVAMTVFAVDYLKAIPFSGWGIAIWVAILIVFVLVFVLMWKYSEKLEQMLIRLFSKIAGKPIIKDIYTVYNIYNKNNGKQKGIGYTEQLPAEFSKEHKDRETSKANAEDIEKFEKNYDTITTILKKEDKPISF